MDLKKIISQDESEAIEFKKSLKSWVIRIKRTAKESFRIYKPDEQNYK